MHECSCPAAYQTDDVVAQNACFARDPPTRTPRKTRAIYARLYFPLTSPAPISLRVPRWCDTACVTLAAALHHPDERNTEPPPLNEGRAWAFFRRTAPALPAAGKAREAHILVRSCAKENTPGKMFHKNTERRTSEVKKRKRGRQTRQQEAHNASQNQERG